MLLGAVSSAAAAADEFFNRVTLLLNTSSTNGAQNNTFLDSSSNNFTITRNGNTTQGTFTPFSQTGWSNYFDGSSWISVPDSTDLDLASGTSWTMEAWVYSTGGSGVQNIMGSQTSAGDVNFLIGLGASNELRAVWSSSTPTAYTVSAPTAVTRNTWIHVAAVNNAGTLSLYVNGTSVGTPQSISGTFRNLSSVVSVGRSGNYAGQYWVGYISNARIVNGTAVYTSNFTPSTIPLTDVTNTKLLTSQSNRFIDTNTQVLAKTVTVGGTPSVQAFSPFAPTAAYDTTTVGGSGYFDGSGDYLSLTDQAAYDFGSGDFSIDFWYYPISAQNYGAVYNRDGQDYPLAIYSGSAVSPAFPECIFAAGTTTTWIVSTLSTSGVKKSSWNHIAFTRVGNTWRAFTNGVLSTVITASGTIGSGGVPWLGRNGTAAGQNQLGMNLSCFRMVKGGIPTLFSTSSTTTGTTIFTPPTSPTTNSESLTAGSLSFLLNFTNSGIYDASSKNDLITVGNAQVSTTQAKFGTTSIAFDGTGDYLTLPASQNFNLSTGDFTIECWFYYSTTPPSGSGYDYLWGLGGTGTTGLGLYIQGGVPKVWNGSLILTTTGSISATTWYHLAVVRSSGTLTVYLNGTSIGSVSMTSNLSGGGSVGFNIARWINASDPEEFTGYIDDLRISKFARYTANFTAPTAAFPIQ